MKFLSDDTFEQFLPAALNSPGIDLSPVTFIDPFGMVGILEVGKVCCAAGERKTLALPQSENVLQYLERMDFFVHAARYLDLQEGPPQLSEKYLRRTSSDVLLEITSIEKSDDIHFIVGKVKKRAHSILKKHLHYTERAVNGFIVALSEVCQNILEHSGSTGFVGIQKYHFQKQQKNVVKIAVMDTGVGFRGSLSERIALDSDMDAIEQALMHGVSRYQDEGRGHGLAAVRRFVGQWNGKITIRSGTARRSIIPEWAWGRQKEKSLVHFPGAQVNLLLPEV